MKTKFKLWHDTKNLTWNPTPCWVITSVQKQTRWKVFNSESDTLKTFCFNVWHVFKIFFQKLVSLSFSVRTFFLKWNIKTRRHHLRKRFETCSPFSPKISSNKIFIQKVQNQSLANCEKLDRETDVFKICIQNLRRIKVVNSKSLCKKDFLSLWCVLKMQTKCTYSQFLLANIKQNVIVIPILVFFEKKKLKVWHVVNFWYRVPSVVKVLIRNQKSWKTSHFRVWYAKK